MEQNYKENDLVKFKMHYCDGTWDPAYGFIRNIDRDDGQLVVENITGDQQAFIEFDDVLEHWPGHLKGR
jgi:hypothetical protein